jgi:lambda family phage minor tail protein L
MSPEVTSANYITEKNKSENTPVMLYEISIPTPAYTLRLCEWDSIIHYPTAGGEDYLPFPLKHEGIGVNALGEIDTVKVTLSAVDRTIISTLIANNGLLGYKVVMKLVFLNQLADPLANVSSTFYIDGVETTEQEATFNLTSKLDLYEVTIPRRMMERDHCQWTFKCEGCWLWSGTAWIAPTVPTFLHSDVDCDHTRTGTTGCIYHANSTRFGGFPGIPLRGIIVA